MKHISHGMRDTTFGMVPGSNNQGDFVLKNDIQQKNVSGSYEYNYALILNNIDNFSSVYSSYIGRIDGNKIKNNNVISLFEDCFLSDVKEIEQYKFVEIPPNCFDFETFTFVKYTFPSIIYPSYVLYIQKDYRSSYHKIFLFSNYEFNKGFLENFKEKISLFTLENYEEIDWCYPYGSSFNIAKFPLKKPKIFHPESYPFIKNVDEWIDGYLNSPETVLILNGPVGTGKSTLIAHLISKAKMKVITAFDEKVMSNDNLYISFISEDYDLLILEDADRLLMERIGKDNDIMSKLLNVAEGIINIGNKKVIFTANLPNLDVIDPAIKRPGRCYDLLQFRELTMEESNVIRKKIGKEEFKKANKEYSLAEVYNK